jgi:hypothetical protein
MGLYQFLTGWYEAFLSIFPGPLQWMITLLVIIGLVGAFIGLIRQSWWFLLLLVILLPVLVPVLRHFFSDLWGFFQYLLNIVTSRAPQPPS